MKDFLYYILEADGRSLQVQNNVVTSSLIPTPIPQAPDGWRDILFTWERNIESGGIVRNFSTAISCLLTARQIVKDQFLKFNIERRLFFLIQRLKLEIDNSTYRYLYEYLYKGEIDLSTFKDDDIKTSVNIMEGGIAQKIKANENTVYPIPFDSEAVNIKMDGIFLAQKINFLIQEGFTAGDHLIGTIETFKEGNAAGLAAFSVFTESGSFDFTTNENYFLAAAQAITGIKLKLAILGDYTEFVSGNVVFYLKSNLGQSIAIHTYTGGTGVIQFDEEITFDAAIGEKFFLFCDVPVANTITYSETNLSVSFSSRKATTYIKGFPLYTLFQKLMEKISGKKSDAVSDLLQAHSNFIVTSGDAIRGIEGAVIKTKLSDFLAAIKVLLFAGWGVESKKFRIEDKLHFFDAADPVNLGEVKEFSLAPAKDYLANTFKIGYTESKIDDVNGKYSFNNSQLYTSPITKIVKEYSLVCPYKADPFEIEIIRINLDGKTTTDANQDNDCFLLNTERSQDDITATVDFLNEPTNGLMVVPNGIEFVAGQKIRITGSVSNDGDYTIIGVIDLIVNKEIVLDQPLVDEAGVSVLIEFLTGIISTPARVSYDNDTDPDDFGVPFPQTVFNIEEMTPKRIAAKHGRWLRSMLWGFDGEKLKFQTTEKNPLLKTIQGSTIIKENDDIEIGSLGEPIFLPWQVEFTTEVPTDLVALMEENPHRCFQFTWNGKTWKGFNVKAAFAPGTLQEQQYQLLLTADNDITEFI